MISFYLKSFPIPAENTLKVKDFGLQNQFIEKPYSERFFLWKIMKIKSGFLFLAQLGNRTIYLCPSGYGFWPYCPQPAYPSDFTWCCTYPYRGTQAPECCQFPFWTGPTAGIFIGGFVVFAVIFGLTCWCCPWCLLYKRLYGEVSVIPERFKRN